MDNFSRSEFSDYTVLESKQTVVTDAVSKKFVASVFSWMFVALGVSAIFAILFASSPELLSYLVTPNGRGASLSILGWAVMFAPLVFVMTMSFAFTRLSVPAMIGFYLAYSAVTGISLSFILLVYTAGSLAGCFATASLMFGVMAVMGYTTDISEAVAKQPAKDPAV